MDEQFDFRPLVEKEFKRFILSQPFNKENASRLVIEKKGKHYQIERFMNQQVFHENIDLENISLRLNELFNGNYKQCNAFSEYEETQIKVSKKRQIFTKTTQRKANINLLEKHNREKNYLIPRGEVIEPLVEMGIMDGKGQIIPSMMFKYRQINRFLEMIDDVLKEDQSFLRIVDFGCGKSYLTFILYYYLENICQRDFELIGLDLKSSVIDHCNETAKKYGYHKLSFLKGDIATFESDKPIDMVISLHACDTATDYALAHAVSWGSRYIFAVPCCQHELNMQMQSDTLGALTRYGLVKERLGALMTDAIRANCLQALNYKTQVLEFIEVEDTPKNILIRAVRTKHTKKVRQKALQEIEDMMETFKIKPTLYTLLEKELKENSNEEI